MQESKKNAEEKALLGFPGALKGCQVARRGGSYSEPAAFVAIFCLYLPLVIAPKLAQHGDPPPYTLPIYISAASCSLLPGLYLNFCTSTE